jgi:hypothetical protein
MKRVEENREWERRRGEGRRVAENKGGEQRGEEIEERGVVRVREEWKVVPFFSALK